MLVFTDGGYVGVQFSTQHIQLIIQYLEIGAIDQLSMKRFFKPCLCFEKRAPAIIAKLSVLFKVKTAETFANICRYGIGRSDKLFSDGIL